MRRILEIVVPLLLPTAIYLGYVLLARRRARNMAGMPWLWLGGAGCLLLAASFVAVALFGGAAPSAKYLPPKLIDGRIVPGHFESAD